VWITCHASQNKCLIIQLQITKKNLVQPRPLRPGLMYCCPCIALYKALLYRDTVRADGAFTRGETVAPRFGQMAEWGAFDLRLRGQSAKLCYGL
jgi:hypothetical protein